MLNMALLSFVLNLNLFFREFNPESAKDRFKFVMKTVVIKILIECNATTFEKSDGISLPRCLNHEFYKIKNLVVVIQSAKPESCLCG